MIHLDVFLSDFHVLSMIRLSLKITLGYEQGASLCLLSACAKKNEKSISLFFFLGGN